MAPVKLKGILSSLLQSQNPALMQPSVFKPFYSILCIEFRPVTLWVNIPLSKRVVCFCSAVSAAVVKLLMGSRVYL